MRRQVMVATSPSAAAGAGKARERRFTRAHFPRGRRRSRLPCARSRARVCTTDQLSASCAARLGQSVTRIAARRGAYRSGVPAKRQFARRRQFAAETRSRLPSSAIFREGVAARQPVREGALAFIRPSRELR